MLTRGSMRTRAEAPQHRIGSEEDKLSRARSERRLGKTSTRPPDRWRVRDGAKEEGAHPRARAHAS